MERLKQALAQYTLPASANRSGLYAQHFFTGGFSAPKLMEDILFPLG
jgi:hypothetical protein